MGTEPISALLGRFKNITPPDDTVRTLTAEVIRRKFNVDMTREQVTLRNGELYIECGPHLRNLLFMHGSEILAEIEKTLGEKTPKGLR